MRAFLLVVLSVSLFLPTAEVSAKNRPGRRAAVEAKHKTRLRSARQLPRQVMSQLGKRWRTRGSVARATAESKAEASPTSASKMSFAGFVARGLARFGVAASVGAPLFVAPIAALEVAGQAMGTPGLGVVGGAVSFAFARPIGEAAYRAQAAVFD